MKRFYQCTNCEQCFWTLKLFRLHYKKSGHTWGGGMVRYMPDKIKELEAGR